MISTEKKNRFRLAPNGKWNGNMKSRQVKARKIKDEFAAAFCGGFFMCGKQRKAPPGGARIICTDPKPLCTPDF
ncbi:MAG: hypothetical protein E7655_09120 [Ruminococcaceae bacterium]|nr:hypothetical protein [Oscillospiraceae bacterium]